MIIVKGGVTAPNGFLASGLFCGIKRSKRKDLALLYSEVPAVAAASFTTNRFQASPIKISKKHLKNSVHQAIITNSGNSNCANGKAGDRNATLMTDFVAQTLALKRSEVLVASTGIIGKALPIEKIKKSIPRLIGELSEINGGDFSEAILTTDTKKKEFAVKLKLGNSIITIGGASKGAGMIYPNLKTERHPSTSLRIVPSERKRVEGHATMLSFLTTDVDITKRMLENAFDEAIDESFNMISIDGDMSTNDSCFILANGLSGNKRIETKDRYYHIFSRALKFTTKELAKKIIQDGEGATKMVEIEVVGAKNRDDAKKVARAISTSNLLKCCIYGEDPNWGRVVSACGSSGVNFNQEKIEIYLGDVKVLSNGSSIKDYNVARTKDIFKKDEVFIKVDLKSGHHKATAWTCDLSAKYVQINAEYST